MSTVRIQVRRGLAADWSSVNPVLAAGEMGYETDTNKFKFGNGTGAWSTLAYGASDTPGVTEIAQDAINAALAVGTGLTKTYNDGANTITVAIDDTVWANKTYVDSAISGLQNTSDSTYILQDDRGVAGGVASLDNSGKVPSDQIAESTIRNAISVSGNGLNYNSTTGDLNIDFSNNPDAVASQGYVATQVSNIVNNAPGALDTLKELSDALGADANFATTVTNTLATKATIASPTFTGVVTIPAGAVVEGYDLISDRTTAVSNAITTAATDATTKVAAEAALRVSGDAASVSTAAADATTKANAAQAAAEATAAASLSSAITLEVSNRNTAIATAKTEAIDAAAADATTKAQDAISTAAADATTKANNAQTAAVSAAGIAADSKVSAHSSDTTDVHGIADTAALATKSYVDAADGLKAPLASPTFTGTVAGITKAMVGLGNVDNTADSAKPVSTATQTALDLKAPLNSPALTGVPTAPTASAGTNTTQVATTAFVGTAVSNLVASAPAALDTLNELATALGNDASFSTTITNSLAAKAPLASPALTGTATAVNLTVSGTTDLSASGVKLSDGTQTKVGVPSITTISQKTASYTLSALTERDAMIEMNSASATTLTVPANSAVAYPVGTSIDILRVGAGAVDVAAAAGVTINATPGLKLRAQWSSATLVKRATDSWVLLGDLSA